MALCHQGSERGVADAGCRKRHAAQRVVLAQRQLPQQPQRAQRGYSSSQAMPGASTEDREVQFIASELDRVAMRPCQACQYLSRVSQLSMTWGMTHDIQREPSSFPTRR